MSNVRASKDDMTERQSGRTPAEEAELQQAIASLNLDVVRELQVFRQWQHSGESRPMTPLRSATARSSTLTMSPSQVQAPPERARVSQPESESASPAAPLLEDLDEEWVEDSGFPIPIPLALAGVTLAALMAGMGVSWLLSPGTPADPSPRTAQQASSQLGTGDRLLLDLAELPLIPVDPASEVRVRSPQRFESTGETLARFEETIPDYRPSELFEDGALPEIRPAFESPELDIRPAANSRPFLNASSTLGSQLGEGTFYVLLDYRGDRSLELAREIEPTAFLKRVGDRTYIQVATFQQLEYARHMADTLGQQGYTTTISQ